MSDARAKDSQPCPFCDGEWSTGRSGGKHLVIHTIPFCGTFYRLGGGDFVRQAKAKRRAAAQVKA